MKKHYWNHKVECTSSKVSKKVIVRYLLQRNRANKASHQFFLKGAHQTKFQTLCSLLSVVVQNEVLLHWWLIPRLPLDSVNLDIGWKKCKPWEALHWKAHLSVICESAGKHFQISNGSCSSIQCTRPYSASVLLFRLQEQL